MPLIIPNKLRALVENYLTDSDRKLEMGGYFFGTDQILMGFLPIPNHAEQTRNQYNLGKTKPFAECYSRMIGCEIVGDMHTHPNRTVPSEQDGRYVNGMAWPYHIIISDKGDSFEWFLVNNKLQTVPWANSNIELEAYSEAVAGEIGLTYLGQVYLSPKGELLGMPEAKEVLIVDQDVLKVRKWKSSLRSWERITIAEAVRETGLSALRVKKALERLEEKV